MASAGKDKKNKQARPVRVAVIGGGCAGLTAAWYLSALPGYQVAVYEQGWRLGGKGASGRDADGRIREHGLHIWLGFYENAFRMMRQCYEEVGAKRWGPDARKPRDRLAHRSLQEAFFPEPHIGVALPDPDHAGAAPFRKWAVWSGYLPPAKGMPGEDLDADTNPFTLANYLVRCYELLKTLMLSEIGPGDAPQPGMPGAGQPPTSDPAIDLDYACDPRRTPAEIVDWSARVLRVGSLTAAAILHQAVLILEKLLEQLGGLMPGQTRLLLLVTAVLEQARKLLAAVVTLDPVLRAKTEIIDIVITIAVGLYRDRVLFDEDGLDAINHRDYREWLALHGASPAALQSEFITGIYDLTFAYEDGDKKKPRLAAGVALRGALRMFFTYRGAMFWRMRSGMGDAVFAPLYKVLLGRGNVSFHFRHTLHSVRTTTVGEEHYVTQLAFDTVGDPDKLDRRGGRALDHFGCWPDTPRRFRGAEAGGKGVRRRIVDQFDAVVFATGVHDFFAVADRAGFILPHWEKTREHVRTAATQSAQVWLSRDLEQLGWYRGSGIITASEPPFETWADMTHTLATEKAWRAAKGIQASPHDVARSVAYFCGVLSDAQLSGNRKPEEVVNANLKRMLQDGVRPLWPDAFSGSATAYDLRVETTHAQANVQGSDRYTLSLPRSPQYRISPLDRDIANMTVAGDWTASGLDAGCVEGAVMSGMLAAHAISDAAVRLDQIVGYDHP